MEPVRAGGATIDRCTSCRGLWLDAAELQRVLQASPGTGASAAARVDRSTPPRTPAGVRRCPRDGEELVPTPDPTQPHVVVDRCRSCLGIFLDAGELRDLAEHTLGEWLRGFLGLGR